MADTMSSEPLIACPGDGSEGSSLSQKHSRARPSAAWIKGVRAKGRHILSSRGKHYVTMVLVVLDVAALLVNVFIQLIACEMHKQNERWVRTLCEGLEIAGLVFSCVFMIELKASLISFGPSYLNLRFHAFDSAIIVISFLVDDSTRGFVADIGSLVVALRLWRLTKLSEEIVAGAAEGIDYLEQRNQELNDGIKELRRQLGLV